MKDNLYHLVRVLLWTLGLLLVATGCQSQPRIFAGSVRDADDARPLTQVRVEVAAQTVTPDSDGRFEAKLPPGTYPVSVSAPGYVTEVFTITVQAAANQPLRDITLVRRTVEGVIQDRSTEQIVAGAQVALGPMDMTTGADGLFRLAAPHPFTLTVTCPGYLPAEVAAAALEAQFGPSGVLTAPLTVMLSPRIVRGQVTDGETATPIAGAVVTLGPKRAQSDAQGRYELSYVEPGQTMTVTHPDYRPPVGIAYKGQERQDLALQPWALRVTVQDAATSKPLEAASLSSGECTAKTAADGSAAIRLRPGSLLSIASAGYQAQQVTYASGESALTVKLQPSRFTGQLRDRQTGRPITRALVLAQPKGGAIERFRADDQGRFVITDALDIREVLVKAPGYRRLAVPIPGVGESTIDLEPFQVRGIYIPFGLLTLPDYITRLLDMVDRTELNAVVVDVKSDRARLAWDSQVPLAQEIGAYLDDVMDLKVFLQECQKRNIYTIARIVVFKDDLLARAHPEWTVRRADGTPYEDLEELLWVDPYRQEVRDYNIALAREVAAMGFDEIQFDYLRFPSDGSVKGLTYGGRGSDFVTRTAAMRAFCAQFYDALSITPAFISADIFGLTTWVKPSSDMGIGQRIDDIAPYADYLSPMLYPSTFIKGNLGLDNPSLYPYEVIYYSVMEAHTRTSTLVRPWLQGYSLGGVTYNNDRLLRQKKGAEDAGSCGWIYWNAGGKYEEAIFQPGAYKLMATIPTPPPPEED